MIQALRKAGEGIRVGRLGLGWRSNIVHPNRIPTRLLKSLELDVTKGRQHHDSEKISTCVTILADLLVKDQSEIQEGMQACSLHEPPYSAASGLVSFFT